MVRIALAVEALVMRAHDHKLVGEHLEPAEDVETDGRVRLHLLELFVGQLAGLLQHGVRHADLADVVDARAPLEVRPSGLVLRREFHLARDHQRVLRHPLRVACRVRVARVDRVRQRFEG